MTMLHREGRDKEVRWELILVSAKLEGPSSDHTNGKEVASPTPPTRMQVLPCFIPCFIN